MMSLVTTGRKGKLKKKSRAIDAVNTRLATTELLLTSLLFNRTCTMSTRIPVITFCIQCCACAVGANYRWQPSVIKFRHLLIKNNTTYVSHANFGGWGFWPFVAGQNSTYNNTRQLFTPMDTSSKKGTSSHYQKFEFTIYLRKHRQAGICVGWS